MRNFLKKCFNKIPRSMRGILFSVVVILTEPLNNFLKIGLWIRSRNKFIFSCIYINENISRSTTYSKYILSKLHSVINFCLHSITCDTRINLLSIIIYPVGISHLKYFGLCRNACIESFIYESVICLSSSLFSNTFYYFRNFSISKCHV